MATTKPSFFFSATQSVDDRLGDAFTFIWANYAGLRELWWQVRGFKEQFPGLHIKEIERKFLSGLPMPGGIDFKHAFLNSDWDAHEQGFSKWLLFECCTLYEGWAEKVCHDLFPSKNSGFRAKNLQYPYASPSSPGYRTAVNDANSSVSPLMKQELFPTLKKSKLNCWPDIDSYLTAYRYFKECRNSIIHSEGLCTQVIIDLQGKLAIEQSKTPSPFRNNFTLPAQTLGEKIILNIRDCILFATIARKLICTFDAALSVAAQSEDLLEHRLRNLTSRNDKWRNLPSDQQKYEQRIHRMLTAAKIPEPQNFGNFILWMKAKKII